MQTLGVLELHCTSPWDMVGRLLLLITGAISRTVHVMYHWKVQVVQEQQSFGKERALLLGIIKFELKWWKRLLFFTKKRLEGMEESLPDPSNRGVLLMPQSVQTSERCATSAIRDTPQPTSAVGNRGNTICEDPATTSITALPTLTLNNMSSGAIDLQRRRLELVAEDRRREVEFRERERERQFEERKRKFGSHELKRKREFEECERTFTAQELDRKKKCEIEERRVTIEERCVKIEEQQLNQFHMQLHEFSAIINDFAGSIRSQAEDLRRWSERSGPSGSVSRPLFSPK